jgi:hypothetical protein
MHGHNRFIAADCVGLHSTSKAEPDNRGEFRYEVMDRISLSRARRSQRLRRPGPDTARRRLDLGRSPQRQPGPERPAGNGEDVLVSQVRSARHPDATVLDPCRYRRSPGRRGERPPSWPCIAGRCSALGRFREFPRIFRNRRRPAGHLSLFLISRRSASVAEECAVPHPARRHQRFWR